MFAPTKKSVSLIDGGTCDRLVIVALKSVRGYICITVVCSRQNLTFVFLRNFLPFVRSFISTSHLW